MIESTPARKLFKQRFGQANHYLITAMVGLEQLDDDSRNTSPKTFTAAWNPQSVDRSVARTRLFLLRSFLGSAVESLEMYFAHLERKPRAIEGDKIQAIFSGTGQKIWSRATQVSDETAIDPVVASLVEVIIVWRNHALHYDVDNKIRHGSAEILMRESGRVQAEYSGLDVKPLLEHLDKHEDFTFKETASLIRASQHYVELVDSWVCDRLNFPRFALDAVLQDLKKSDRHKTKYLTLTSEKRLRYVESLIRYRCRVENPDSSVIASVNQGVSAHFGV